MLERAPSAASGSESAVPSSSQASHGPQHRKQHCVVVSARHLARGCTLAGRALLFKGLLPATRVTCRATCALASATAHAATSSGRAVARTTGRFARFVTARRPTIAGFDGTDLTLRPQEPQDLTASVVSLSELLTPACPPPLSNLSHARIILRDCRDTRLRVEYCQDCVIVARRLQRVELLLVGCRGVKLVLKDCSQLLLRELQCGPMGDHVRTRCPGFTHEIVCLRCVCKPVCVGGGPGAWFGASDDSGGEAGF